MAAKKKIEVIFVKSPTGLFKLGYHVADVVKFEAKQADELINAGVAQVYKPATEKDSE